MPRDVFVKLSGMFIAVSVLFVLSCATTTRQEDINSARAHYKLGVSHLQRDRLQAAFVEFQTALRYDPDNKEIHNALGTVYLKLQDLGMAVESYGNAISLDPDYSEAHNNLCYAYYRLKKWSRAVESCRDALRNPLYLTAEKAYYNLGRAQYRLGNYDEAIDAYDNALKRMPGLYIAYYGLALSYNARKDYGRAASAIARGVQQDPAFRGDIEKAAREFSRRTGEPEDMKDFRDLVEILNY